MRNAAVEHQRRLQQQLQYNAVRDAMPLGAAPMMPEGLASAIMQRVGLSGPPEDEHYGPMTDHRWGRAGRVFVWVGTLGVGRAERPVQAFERALDAD